MTTLLQFPTTNQRGISQRYIRDGVAGNVKVVHEMVRLIRNSVDNDKGIEAVAKHILISKGLDSYSRTQDQLNAVYEFVKDHVKYVEDIAGAVESIKTARRTLSDGYGDCDDHTDTNATLLGCLGFEEVRIALARYDENDAAFSHVYCVCYHDGKRYVLDTTLPHGKLGDEVNAVEVKEVSIFDDVAGLDGISGLFNNTVYHSRKLAKAATETIPHIAEFLPIGFFSTNALASGAQLLNQDGYEQRSYNSTASRINKELDGIIIDLMRSRIAFDLAQSYALQCVAQLGAVKNIPQGYETIRDSVNSKLTFIKDFESYATENGIKVVYLDSRMMLVAGAGLAAYGGYKLYKNLRGRR